MLLKDRVAIVTGGASGIGFGTAKRFLQEGAKVAICDVRQEAIDQAVEQLKEFGPVKGFVTDISDRSQCDALAKAVAEEFGGRIDILINNAGITKDAQFYKMKDEDFYKVVEVNLFGTYNMSKAVVPYMMEQRYGKIVSASSIACIKGNFGQSNYAASKAAIMSFTRSLGRELGKYGINVNAIAPGFIRTAMTDKIPPDIMKQKIDSIPMRRTGEVADIAAAYTFLASDEASFVNATTLIVDGGMS